MAARNVHYGLKSLFTLTVFLAAAACVTVRESPEAAPTLPDTLQMDSTRWWHPQLGFSVPNPGGFTTTTVLQQVCDEILAKANANGKIFIWAFARPSTGEMVMIQAFNNGTLGRDEEGWRQFVHRMRRRLHERLLPRGKVEEDTLIWTPETREYRLVLHHANGAFVKCRCVASGPTRARPLAVCATTISADSNGLDALRRGLALDPIPGGQ